MLSYLFIIGVYISLTRLRRPPPPPLGITAPTILGDKRVIRRIRDSRLSTTTKASRLDRRVSSDDRASLRGESSVSESRCSKSYIPPRYRGDSSPPPRKPSRGTPRAKRVARGRYTRTRSTTTSSFSSSSYGERKRLFSIDRPLLLLVFENPRAPRPSPGLN